MATPTRLDVESSSTERATPNPEKKAMGKPVKKVTLVARLFISDVGQFIAISVQKVVIVRCKAGDQVGTGESCMVSNMVCLCLHVQIQPSQANNNIVI